MLYSDFYCPGCGIIHLDDVESLEDSYSCLRCGGTTPYFELPPEPRKEVVFDPEQERAFLEFLDEAQREIDAEIRSGNSSGMYSLISSHEYEHD
jgi:hypothetical protein